MRAAKRRRAGPAQAKDGPTAEQEAHAEYQPTETLVMDEAGRPERAVARRNVSSSPLDLHYRRRRLSRAQFEAGDRFREEYYLAGLLSGQTAAYMGAGVGAGDPRHLVPTTERAAQARASVRGAFAAVGLAGAAVLARFLIQGQTATEIGHAVLRVRARNKAKELGMQRVRETLTTLAGYYRR